MNKFFSNLIIFLFIIALSNNANAIELDQTGKIDIHGFLSQGYMQSNHNNFYSITNGHGSSQFNEIGIDFSTDVSDRLRMGVQILSRDLGKMGNHEVTFDWAVADYSFYDWLNLRAGKIKIPHGIYNMERDVDMLRANIFLPQSVYYEGWRDSINTLSGVGIYGYVPMEIMGNITYNVSGGNLSMKHNNGEARLLSTVVPIQMNLQIKEMDTILSYDGYLSVDDIAGIEGLKIAGSYLRHEFDIASTLSDGTFSPTYDANMTVVGLLPSQMNSTMNIKMGASTASIEFACENTVFAAEYSDTSYNIHIPVSPYINPNGMMENKFTSIGYYAGLTHRFSDWFQIGTYYSVHYSDKDDKDGYKSTHTVLAHDANHQPITLVPQGQEFTRWLKDTCLGFRFDITPNWVMKLEGHYMDGAALLLNDDNNMNSLGKISYDRYWMLYAAKLSFSF